MGNTNTGGCGACGTTLCICAGNHLYYIYQNTLPPTQTASSIPNGAYPTLPVASPELERKQLKIFLHFSNEFILRYPQWIIQPDASRPFGRIILLNPERHIKFFDKFPMNELEVVGLTIDEYDKLYPFGITGMPRSPLIPYTDFQYWALGIDELPELLR